MGSAITAMRTGASTLKTMQAEGLGLRIGQGAMPTEYGNTTGYLLTATILTATEVTLTELTTSS